MAATPNPTGAAHWLYVVVDGRVYVYDIDNNHTLVKQFPIPSRASGASWSIPDEDCCTSASAVRQPAPEATEACSPMTSCTTQWRG